MPAPKHKQAILIALVGLVILVGYLLKAGKSPALFPGAATVLSPEATEDLKIPVAPMAEETRHEQPLPEKNSLVDELQSTSLRGTDIDRSMLRIVDGELVLDGGLLFYFDYFLALEGEMPLADIRQLVWRDLQANYPEAIAAQIFDIFERYLEYLAEVGRREDSVTSEQVLTQNLSAKAMQDEVRRQFFSEAEIAALFVSYDAMLSKPSQASARQKIYEQYRQAIAENPGQLESVATELFGAAAAQNLRNVEYQRQQWAGRVAHYEREKQAIMESYANDLDGRQQALALLQQRLFSETEVRRVQALERIKSTSP
jgi:lipase chaperone LimK